MIRTPIQDIGKLLEDNDSVPEVYDVTQPSVKNAIGKTGIRRAKVIHATQRSWETVQSCHWTDRKRRTQERRKNNGEHRCHVQQQDGSVGDT